jgi:hypothetical protein
MRDIDTLIGHSNINKRLEVFIFILYGAVLSFGIFKMAELISEGFHTFYLYNARQIENIIFQPSPFIKIALYIITSCFLICDFSGMIKVNNFFPYLRPSRFFIDCMIPFIYLLLFIACARNSILFPFEFSLLLFLCGAWGNNLYVDSKSIVNELPDEFSEWDIYDITKSTAENYGKTIRNTHYAGGFLFIFLTIVFVFWNHEASGNPVRHITLIQGILLVLSIAIWYFSFVVYAVVSSKSVDHLLLPILPGIIRKLAERIKGKSPDRGE